MSLGSFIRKAIPVAVGAVTGGPVGAYVAASNVKAQERQTRQIKRAQAEQKKINEEEQRRMAEIFGTGNVSSVQPNLQGRAVTQSGFGAGFGTFLSDVGRNIVSPISSLATQVLPFFGSRDNARQPASTRVPILQGTELQATGTNEAFIGSIPNVIGGAARFLRTPGGAFGTGTATGILPSLLGGSSGTMRVTKKTKRLAQQAYSLGMGDLGTSISIFAQLTGLEVSQQEFVLILTKRFRNDGPVITKAALRKTKTTLRRMKNMCDMYDSLRKAPTRRRTTMKRAVGTTLISNK